MYRIDIQITVPTRLTPSKTSLRMWAKQALQEAIPSAEVSLRIVDVAEMTKLNSTYRKKTGPTNVLSFPTDLPADIAMKTPLLGDIVICADVVNREAEEQHKTAEAHWAHMVVHGVFHLLGHDHENDHDADIMEKLEISVLNKLGFSNPYDINTGDTR